MAIPVYLWLVDDGGREIKGSVSVAGRENSIEVLELMHGVSLPVDVYTGAITGPRIHSTYAFEKEIDSFTPYLYKAATTGQTLKSAIFDFYKIDDAGQERKYFMVTLLNVRVASIMPLMYDVKDPLKERHGHHEYIELRYENIKWHYIDGNVIHEDDWEEIT